MVESKLGTIEALPLDKVREVLRAHARGRRPAR